MRKFLAVILIIAAFAAAVYFSGNGGALDLSTLAITPAPTLSPRPDDSQFHLLVEAVEAEDAARSAESTARAYRVILTAQAQTQQAYETAIFSATSAVSTHQAGATSTQQAWQIIGWTATADSDRATSQADAALTVTADYRLAVEKTESLLSAQATRSAKAEDDAAAYQARLRDNDLRQRELKIWIEPLWPYAIGAVGAILALVLIFKITPYLSILGDRHPDEAGRYPIVVNAKSQYYAPGRHPYANGEPGMYQHPNLTPEQLDLQARVITGEQAVEMIRNTEPGQSPSAALPGQITAGSPQLPASVNFRILPPEVSSQALDPGVRETLDGEWKEANRANDSDRSA